MTSYRDSSPDDKKSEKSLSVKSGRSNNSQRSNNKSKNVTRKNQNVFSTYGQYSHLNKSNSKKIISNKKSSIYDSDTESSRMRRIANSRSSPYRQPIILNNKTKKVNNERSRSRSRDNERLVTPKASVTMESQMMTDGYPSGSSEDEDYDKIQGYLNSLKERKGNNFKSKKNSNQNSGSKIQKRL